MDSRERLLLAMDGSEPDRIPCALGFYHVDLESLVPTGQDGNQFLDIRFVRFSVSPEEEELRRLARPYDPDTRLGTPVQMATYIHWDYRPEAPDHRNPLARARSFEELVEFPFPDPGARYDVDGLGQQVETIHARGQAAGGNLPHLGGELFEAAWRLRGLENFLLDLLERPTWAHFLLDRLADLARRNAETLARAGVDVLALDDDVGMPRTMMISPKLWRVFFKPRLESIILAARIINPDLLDYLPLSEEYRVVEINLPEIFIGKSLAELNLRKKYNILVIAIKTPHENQIEFMPTAETILKRGNTVVVMGNAADIAKLQEAD